MKKINILFATLMMLTLTWSCEEKSNLDPEKPDNLSVPELAAPGDNGTIVLDQTTPDATISFSWQEAVSSLGDDVTYTFFLAAEGTTDFAEAIIENVSDNDGEAITFSISHKELDEILSYAEYAANETAQFAWAVEAKSLTKRETASGTVSIKRFENEIVPEQLFLSGLATENGDEIASAIPMKRLNGTDGNPSNKYEVFTNLSTGLSFSFYSKNELPAFRYGGSEGNLVKSGDAIEILETAEYRVTVDLDANTYALQKIEKWSVVGGPLESGWGGDAPLEYQGGGVWKASIECTATGGFAFRANGDWGIMLKRVQGTDDQVVLESEAANEGVSYEDIPSEEKGWMIFTLNLSADGYTYSIVRDPDAVQPLEAPEKMFVFADGTKLAELTKDGNVFTSDVYLALQTGVNYSLNSQEDGNGTSYALAANIGATDSPDGDKVSGLVTLTEGATAIAVERDQAYKIEVDFDAMKLGWEFFNIKLFHWSDWDSRNEFLMTYEHPYKFSVTADLVAGYEMKFNSPWDVQFGADDASAMSGTMTNGGGSNFTNITTDGSYKASITITDDYQTGTYEFVAQ